MVNGLTNVIAIIALVSSLTLILLTDRFGRRLVVVYSAIICTFTMLIVGILGFVPKTEAPKNFLIFIACMWSFFNIARKFSFYLTLDWGSSSSQLSIDH